MAGEEVRGREAFEEQGLQFLRANLEKSEWDFAAYRPQPARTLARSSFTFVYPEESLRMKLTFGETELECEVVDSFSAGMPASVPYQGFELAPDLFFFSFLGDKETSFACVVDLDTGAVTSVRGRIVDGDIESTALAGYVQEVGCSARQIGHPAFPLGGTRLLNQYADNVAYEHIYLNDVYVTWLGIEGPEPGQADTEEYRSFKIREGVYLVFWKERVLKTQMTFMFNFLRGECAGQVFALLDDQPVHNAIGARTYLIHTALSELPEVPRLKPVGS